MRKQKQVTENVEIQDQDLLSRPYDKEYAKGGMLNNNGYNVTTLTDMPMKSLNHVVDSVDRLDRLTVRTNLKWAKEAMAAFCEIKPHSKTAMFVFDVSLKQKGFHGLKQK